MRAVRSCLSPMRESSLKMKVNTISVIGRNTSGVKLMDIDPESGVVVASIAKVRESSEDEDEELDEEFGTDSDGEDNGEALQGQAKTRNRAAEPGKRRKHVGALIR